MKRKDEAKGPKRTTLFLQLQPSAHVCGWFFVSLLSSFISIQPNFNEKKWKRELG